MAYLFNKKVTLYPGDSALGAWRPAVSTLGSQPFSTVPSCANANKEPIRAPFPQDIVFPLSDATPIPWQYYLRPQGVTEALAKSMSLCVTSQCYSLVPASADGPGCPKGTQMLTFSVSAKDRASVALFEIEPTLARSLVPSSIYDPRRGGPRVRCTVEGSTQLFVNQYGKTLLPLEAPQALNEKVGSLAFTTRVDSEGTWLVGCCFTLDGVKSNTHLVDPVKGSPDAVIRTILALLQTDNVSGWTFYTHRLAARYSGYLEAVLAGLHNQKNGQWQVTYVPNKEQGLLAFEVTSRTDKTFKVVFKDSYSLWPAELTEIATTIGNRVAPSRSGVPATLKGQTQDLANLQYSMVRWLNQHLYECFGVQITQGYSLSGMAISLYRSKYLPEDVRFTTGPKAFFTMIRESAYVGGLVHVEKPKHVFKEVYAYDMTSMYPSQMKSNPMPGGDAIWVDQMPPLGNPLCFGWVEAVARAPSGILPCLLPLREVEGDTNNQCIGHSRPFAGLFFSEELKEALALGYEIEIFGGYMFEPVTGAFTDFVDTLTKQRQEYKTQGETGLAAITKQLLNGLYGRFAMNSDWQTALIEKPGYEGKTSLRSAKLGDARGIMGVLTFQQNSTEATSTSLPVAAATTAYARIEMSKFKNLPGNPLLYSDTDSVILERPLSSKQAAQFVSSSGEAGKLKFEGKWAEFVAFGNKHYTYLDELGAPVIKTAGGVHPDLTHETIVAHALASNGEPLRTTQTMAGTLRRETGSYGPTITKEVKLAFIPSPSPIPVTNVILTSPLYKVASPRLKNYIANPTLMPERLKVNRNL